MLAATKGVEALFAHYPGIESKVSIPEFMAARQEISEERFRRVEPMKGAIALVKGLVRTLSSLLIELMRSDGQYEAGVPIAIATGSNMESFKWKTVHLSPLPFVRADS
jgi:pseudouridine-5'-monophosphatase